MQGLQEKISRHVCFVEKKEHILPARSVCILRMLPNYKVSTLNVEIIMSDLAASSGENVRQTLTVSTIISLAATC